MPDRSTEHFPEWPTPLERLMDMIATLFTGCPRKFLSRMPVDLELIPNGGIEVPNRSVEPLGNINPPGHTFPNDQGSLEVAPEI